MDDYELLLQREIADVCSRIAESEDFCLTVDDEGDDTEVSSINFASTIDLGLPQDFC